jgi:hypothetical protein
MRAASLFVLVVGVTSGALIYASMEDPGVGAMDEMLMSKQYSGTIQRFGGKQAVLLDDLSRWFAGLWQGKRLGVTVGCLSVALAGVLYLVSRRTDHDK